MKCEEDKDEQKVHFTILKGDKSGEMKIKVTENRRRLIADVRSVIKFHHGDK
jgi:hypothetical protein